MMETEKIRQEISTDEASQISGFSRNHITHLLRQGKLEGKNYGQRVWGVYRDSLEKYMASPHKSGPKGPRKRSGQDLEGASNEHNNSLTVDSSS